MKLLRVPNGILHGMPRWDHRGRSHASPPPSILLERSNMKNVGNTVWGRSTVWGRRTFRSAAAPVRQLDLMLRLS